MKIRNILTIVAFTLLGYCATAQDYDLRTTQSGLDIVVEILYTGAGAPPTTANFMVDLGFEIQSTDQTMIFGPLNNDAGYGFSYQGAQTGEGGLARRTVVTQNPIPFPEDLSSTVYKRILQLTLDTDPGTIVSVGALGTHPIQPGSFPYINVDGMDFIPTATAGQALPVEWTTFEVAKLSESSTDLKWTTETELNFSHFEVERSISDATRFVQVGQVEGFGNTMTTKRYSFVDADVPTLMNEPTIAYYRLKMVDVNGQFEYTEIRSVTFEARANDITLYPNPTSEFIVISSELEVQEVLVYNIDGKLVYSQVTGKNINVSNFDTGLYKVLIQTEAGTVAKSMVKIN